MSDWKSLEEVFRQSTEEWKKSKASQDEQNALKKVFLDKCTPSQEYTDEEWEAIQQRVDELLEVEHYKERGYVKTRHQILQEVLSGWKGR